MGAVEVPELQYSEADEEEWDKLWIAYFKKEPQQLSFQEEVRLDSLPGSRDEFIDTPALFIACDQEAIVNKAVMEIGCGCGFLAKHIAHFTRYYLGIDWSGLALLVAKRTCRDRCIWLHPSEMEQIRAFAQDIDTVLFRNLMIHQDFSHAKNVLLFSQSMLKPGGRIYADFWLDSHSSAASKVYPARSEIKGRPRNVAYRFADQEIIELAAEAHLEILDSNKRPDKLRNFVAFLKPPNSEIRPTDPSVNRKINSLIEQIMRFLRRGVGGQSLNRS